MAARADINVRSDTVSAPKRRSVVGMGASLRLTARDCVGMFLAFVHADNLRGARRQYRDGRVPPLDRRALPARGKAPRHHRSHHRR